MKLTEQQSYMLLGASPALALGLGIGLATGLFIAQKKLEKKYNDISNREIAEAKQFYSILHKKDEFETPAAVVESLGLEQAVTALQEYQGEHIFNDVEAGVRDIPEDSDDLLREQDNAPKESVHVVKRNIFTDAETHVVDDDDEDDDTDAFDYDEELKHRGEIEPYVISHDEFMENEMDSSQITLTFYEGDDVLTDEKEQPIPDVEETIGEDNLQRFGHGSRDPNVVYIRNPRLDVDFEVTLSKGNYTEEVLGFIQHSDSRTKIRRFRDDDE